MVVPQQRRHLERLRLRSQVLGASGSATKFRPIEQHLARWIQSGPDTPQATVDTVLPYLAGYLDKARSTGRRWGTVAGAAFGLLLGLVAFVIVVVMF